jgi:hypothetical protein
MFAGEKNNTILQHEVLQPSRIKLNLKDIDNKNREIPSRWKSSDIVTFFFKLLPRFPICQTTGMSVTLHFLMSYININIL